MGSERSQLAVFSVTQQLGGSTGGWENTYYSLNVPQVGDRRAGAHSPWQGPG